MKLNHSNEKFILTNNLIIFFECFVFLIYHKDFMHFFPQPIGQQISLFSHSLSVFTSKGLTDSRQCLPIPKHPLEHFMLTKII